MAKILANRLNSCIIKCVHEDQFAFIKGRQVGDLLREINDILDLGKMKFPDSIILSLDYAKAFDTVSISAIKKALAYFGFDGNFIKWVNILLHSRLSCVQNGGYLSEYFQMERGVRQGCPISPLFFILTLELLARNIRKSPSIKGLSFSGTPVKIRLYADDATLFLKDMIDYREVLSRIKSFTSFSGLCLNKQKSAAMMLGNIHFKNRIKFGIKFQNTLSILGITFSNECSANEIVENFNKKIAQLERLCHLWGKRFLTLLGRITILKSFGISLFIYLMQSIGISDENLKTINSIIYRFIWNPRAKKGHRVTEKVKRNIINKPYENGGLNMIDLNKLQDSFLLKWADRLLNSSSNRWKDIPSLYFEKVGGISAFSSDLRSNEFKGLDLIGNPFWRKVLTTWLDYKNVNNSDRKIIPSIHDPIFNNSLIKFKQQVLFNQRCIKQNIIFIRDVLDHGVVISFRAFSASLDSPAESMMTYNVIFNALKKYSLQFISEIDDGSSERYSTTLFRGHETGGIGRRTFYNLIRCPKIESVKGCWLDALPITENDSDIWCVARLCCSETRVLELQWKILHAIYPTAVLLNKMKIKDNELCEFCGERDTLLHFFVSCHISKAVWVEAEKLASKICGRRVILSDRDKIVGILSMDSHFVNEKRIMINKIILICKRTISKYKYEKVGNIIILLENQLSFRGLLD